jgi:hypothetical protein
LDLLRFCGEFALQVNYLLFQIQGLGREFFSPPSHTGSGAHSASYSIGIGVVLSSVITRPGREADTSPPSITGVKNAWSCTTGVKVKGEVIPVFN